ncbi:MAG: DUF420 domain-containing protein [Candidatus Cyclobacteriaceae bacterium M2_1C_046]
MSTVVSENKKYKKLIIGLSVAIPFAVAALFGIKIDGYDFSYLPPVYATINGFTAILLVAAFIAIKNKKVQLHERLIKTCLALSASFLVMYILYHMTSDPTSYGGEGAMKVIYFVILITHIILSIAVIPLVLFSYLRAWLGNYESHRKLAKVTFPIWLYVAVTGVVVYLMISPYYG